MVRPELWVLLVLLGLLGFRDRLELPDQPARVGLRVLRAPPGLQGLLVLPEFQEQQESRGPTGPLDLPEPQALLARPEAERRAQLARRGPPGRLESREQLERELRGPLDPRDRQALLELRERLGPGPQVLPDLPGQPERPE